MVGIRIHVFHTGKVCVSPYLPFGGDNCSIFKAAGLITKKEDRLWLPVSAYLIEHPQHGLILVDCGWDRSMSPDGVFDKQAQIASFGSRMPYRTNQGVVEKGATVPEQLAALGYTPSDLDCVLLTHLDCDHANGIPGVSKAKRFLVAHDELACVRKGFIRRIRYQSRWWEGVKLEDFEWNATEGPFSRSFDVFGDGSIRMVNIPGHCPGLCAVKVMGDAGRYVLLFSDGGYATRSWQEMVTSGIADDKERQRASLAWIREQSLSPDCIESLANHDPDVQPHVIEL